jgi:hypothetical protein
MYAPLQTLNKQGNYLGDKTFAFTSYHVFQSGWTSPLGRFASVPPETIINNSDIPFESHNFDGNVAGRYFASHAELQAWNMEEGNYPIVVTREMCESCQKQFKGYAKKRGEIIYVGSPMGIHTFTPNGNPHISLREEGVDANDNHWTMWHEQGQTNLVTTRSEGKWTESTVCNARSGTQYYHDPKAESEYAEYYPNKTTEILMEDENLERVGRTHVGPSNGTVDCIDGVRYPVKPSERV